ncbi:MAG: DUF4830 domain-containing protein [Oscillospiraceae bacterium]|jgi:hypothetical protein|nr:DUF4830 domain-containing protein [Oscillospiraceae bacterium]
MFVYSIRSSKLKLGALILLIAAAVIALIALTQGSKAAVRENSAIRLTAANAADRLAFLSQFGWETAEDPLEVSEVIIPATFDETYTRYNDIQKAQGMNLLDYAGKRVKRWTYEIKNYPGYENKPGVVQANLLVSDGTVIGGDICSLELGGFLHGFDFPELRVPVTSSQTSPSPLA